MEAQLQMHSGDVRDHDEQCSYRRFVEEGRENNLHIQASMEKELRRNYEAETVLSRPGSRKRKRGKRKVATVLPKPLSSDEEASVIKKIEEAVAPNSLFQWYLKSQREKVQQAKLHLHQLCECTHSKMDIDKNAQSGVRPRDES